MDILSNSLEMAALRDEAARKLIGPSNELEGPFGMTTLASTT